MRQRYDAVVIGAGPAGEAAATRLNGQGLRTALVERELVGGECAYWACIPSKTLLRPAEVRSEARRTAGTAAPAQQWSEIADYRDFMIRHLGDSNEVKGHEQDGVRVYKGAAKLAGLGRIEVGGETLEAERIVIATGSEPRIPPIRGLAEAGYWTNREATTLREIPGSVVILGGGPVGVDTGGGRRTVSLDGGSQVSGEQLLVAVGRTPRVKDIGLESVGIEAGPRGIEVDERCRAAERIWAIGDVTGVMPFTHVGMYQARIACEDIAGRDPRAHYDAIPRVVFADPEVAAVGLTEQEAHDRGVHTAVARLRLADAIDRPWTYEMDPRGEIGILADRTRNTLIGAWAVSPLAGEWIHYAALAIKTQTPLDVLRDTVAQFPTYTEAYVKAIEQLDLA